MQCVREAVVSASQRWHHRLRLGEAVISSRGGATLFGLCEPLSPSLHLPARVAPPPSRRCSRSQVVRTQQVSKAVPAAASGPARFKNGLPGELPGRILARKMSILSTAQNFLPLRGADKVAPCGAGNFNKGGGAKQRLEIVAELNRRGSLRCYLFPKIEVRQAKSSVRRHCRPCFCLPPSLTRILTLLLSRVCR